VRPALRRRHDPKEVFDMAFLATATLFLTVASLLVIGGVVFAPFLAGLFLLALLGVLAGRGDRRVTRRGPATDATGWRTGA
jgi:hypothetical protein